MSAMTEMLNWLPPDFLARIDAAGYAIVPLHPTADMIQEGLHPARPGSIGDIYREMVKAGRVTA
jgi:hypothetical protein